MDIQTSLILLKTKNSNEYEDKTAEISHIQYIDKQIAVTFLANNKTYNYHSSNVLVLKNPKTVNVDQQIISIDGFPLGNASHIYDFGEYIKVVYKNGRAESFHKSKVSYDASCLISEQPKAVFGYLKGISKYINVTEDGKAVLFDQYERIVKISEQSVLATYLSGKQISKKKNKNIPIFPFGLNLSQRKAVETALENSISIIEGPPGTGKTQTILNIIANVISRGQTVGIVSGNNSATANVQEKLEKNGFGFVTALLGNAEKKKDFFENKQVSIPNIKDWEIASDQTKVFLNELSSISSNLNSLLEDQNRIAKLKEELSRLEVEKKYFENHFRDSNIPISKISIIRKWTSDSILNFITLIEKRMSAGQKTTLAIKTSLFFRFGIYKFKLFEEHQKEIVSSLKSDFYNRRIEERKKQIERIETRLGNKNFNSLMEEYTDVSKKLFKEALFKKYSKRARGSYTLKSFKNNFKNFTQDYPVILSTTHSIMTCIAENYLFDYLIIDEASQVDLVTASLALACTKNIVIVGDVHQLPHIVTQEIKLKSDELFYSKNLSEPYSYSKYSIIASLMELYKGDLPKTLLSEHYRCHPKIIGFCNEKFYHNQLVIMTEEHSDDVPLKIYKTSPGNHAREDKSSGSLFNLRQIEVVKDEVLNKSRSLNQYGDIGIITPYRKQVTETIKYFAKPEIEIDTIHKFQGREKETIIFTTVANQVTPFVDDANLINVAVSRAVKEFIMVTSNRLYKKHGTNLGDLIRYIEYNSYAGKAKVIESQKVSVFDLLYSEYSKKLLTIMDSMKQVSKYKSENLMYKVIEEVLALPEFNSFKCVLHVPLYSIVKDMSILNQKERTFAEHPWTHVDFLIFNRLDKEPVLVVEVDGYEFHQNNEKQKERDALKDIILDRIDLPHLRIVTNESGEREKLIKKLDEVVRLSDESQ